MGNRIDIRYSLGCIVHGDLLLESRVGLNQAELSPNPNKGLVELGSNLE